MSTSNENQEPIAAKHTICALSHTTDHYRCHPGDEVAFCTRIQVRRPVHGLTLRIGVPEGLDVSDTQSPDDAAPQLAVGTGTAQLVWNVAGTLEAGNYEYRVTGRVTPAPQIGQHDWTLKSRAALTAHSKGDEPVTASETVSIAVSDQGRYIKYLPGIYQEDDLMGRFLMLFESFWAPTDRQIDNVYQYFDPKMTPSGFLPWLASWLGLTLAAADGADDERWPEERQRQLIQRAVALYRMRGTKRGLQEFLEIFTGEQVEISEQRASNFCLGQGGRLSLGVALGRKNVPHTFTVTLHMPPAENKQRELQRRQAVETIIDAQKPAHTRYILRIHKSGRSEHDEQS